jgi:hypothetical protein
MSDRRLHADPQGPAKAGHVVSAFRRTVTSEGRWRRIRGARLKYCAASARLSIVRSKGSGVRLCLLVPVSHSAQPGTSPTAKGKSEANDSLNRANGFRGKIFLSSLFESVTAIEHRNSFSCRGIQGPCFGGAPFALPYRGTHGSERQPNESDVNDPARDTKRETGI